jgi:magnesium transporter
MTAKHRRPRKHRHAFRRQSSPGAPPGTVAVDPAAAQPVMDCLAFDDQRLVETRLQRPEQALEYMGHWPVTWVNVCGLGDAEVLQGLGRAFGLHPLALEDVVNVHQRAKVEQYGAHLFIVARMPRDGGRLDTEQVSLFLGRDFVLTFIEDPGDCFDAVRSRLRHDRGRIREFGPDHLAYALLDAVVDAYFPVLERYGELLDHLEEEALTRRGRGTIARIHAVKTDLLALRRAVWPHRELFNALVRDPNPLITAETRVYFRDCYDHAVQMIDLLELYRELGSDLRDLYLTSVSNRMNEVMKVLTVITTIFMPLTLITGIYGMNFDTAASPWNMPELGWRFGYPIVLATMAAVTAGMLFVFRRQGWLGDPKTRADEPSASEVHGPEGGGAPHA